MGWLTDDMGQVVWVDDEGKPEVVYAPGGGGTGNYAGRSGAADASEVMLNGEPDVIAKAPVIRPGKSQAELDLELKLAEALKALQEQKRIADRVPGAYGQIQQRILFPGLIAKQARIAEAIAAEMERQQSLSIMTMDSTGVPAVTGGFSAMPPKEVINKLAEELSLEPRQVQQIAAKLVAGGASALTMALSGGNFPLGAMAYFTFDRALSPSGLRDIFAGYGDYGEGVIWDGVPLAPVGLEIPEGLPNEIFGEYRFICYDRLTGKFWPSDEVQPLSYSGKEFRWLCLDRVDGKVYHANLIKRPRIYLD